VIVNQTFKKPSHNNSTILSDMGASGILSPLLVKKVTRAKCPHGKQSRTRCAECLGHSIPKAIVKKCPHNLIKSRCEDCVGHPIMKKKQAPLCVHGRQKCRCVDCLGVCEHGIGKWRCVQCGATARKPRKKCSHGRVKHRCTDCLGVCEHGIGKWRCVDCGATARKPDKMCPHNKRKSRCLLCVPGCMQGHIKKSYKNCDAGPIKAKRCQHGKFVTSQCKQCQALNGVIEKRIYKSCIHDIPRNNCKICGNQNICVHGKRLHLCRICGGNSFCSCDGGKMKNVCPKHGGIALCINCIHWPDPRIKNTVYGEYCARCFKNKWPDDPKSKKARQKVKEDRVKIFLQDNHISFVQDRAVLDRDSSCDNSASRPDFQVQHTHQELVSIYVEIDESQHQTKSYTDTCELVRLNNIITSHQFRRPLVVIRYNPDPFTVGTTRITCKELSRKAKEDIFLRELNDVIVAAANPELFPPLLRVVKIGFDCNCADTTECGFVHTTNYPDQESLLRAYNQMQ